jgi:hypothetical protein
MGTGYNVAVSWLETARASLTEADEHLPVRQRERVREIRAELVAVEDELVDGPRSEPGAL